MTPEQLTRISAAYDTLFATMAGDNVTYISPTGISTDLICILYNLKFEHKPGLIIDLGGLREQDELEMLFSTNILNAANVTLDVAGYWMIDGVRYDFAEKEPIKEKLNPVGGLQNLVSCRVRLSAEINQTETGAVWSLNEN